MSHKSMIPACMVFAVVGCTSTAQQIASPESMPISKAVGIVADVRKIVTGQGVEESRAIPVNGIEQWISVRGKDRRNPILLLLHGGPGSAEMPNDWTFQTPWEDFFTVVEWDQRGAGKTYAMNDPTSSRPP